MKSSQKQHKKCILNDHNFLLTLLFVWKSQLGCYYCKNRKKGKCEELLKKKHQHGEELVLLRPL